MNSDPSTVTEPPICDFTNWNEFYPAALRYHRAMHQGRDLVVDRIETFRKYMSPDVIESLGGFVRSHPRFCTTSGWDQWLADVAELISIHSAIHDEEPPYVNGYMLSRKMIAEQATTVKDLIELCRKRKTTSFQLWQRLDTMVSNNAMSTTEQHQLFWGALSEDEKERLMNKCSFFDPQDEIWEKQESDVVKMTQQTLSKIIEFSVLDEYISLLRKSKKFVWMFLVVNWLLLAALAYNALNQSRFLPVVMLSSTFVFGAVQNARVVVAFARQHHLLRVLGKRQQELVFRNLA